VTDWADCTLGHSDLQSCSFTYNASGTDAFSYDLSGLASNTFLKITDTFSHEKQNYDYYFNLCRAVNVAQLPDVCNITYGTGSETCAEDAMAYQYVQTSWGYENCYRLSDCFDDGPDIEIGLLDPVEPASGVYFLVRGGNTCPNSYSDKAACTTLTDDWVDTAYCSRSFKLNVKCHNEIMQVPEKEHVVENSGCAYEATINHVAGCPLECPRSASGQVCSARGVCFFPGYDSGEDAEGVTDISLQCLCEQGYSGERCELVSYLEVAVQAASSKTGIPNWIIVMLAFFIASALIFFVFSSKFAKLLWGGVASDVDKGDQKYSWQSGKSWKNYDSPPVSPLLGASADPGQDEEIWRTDSADENLFADPAVYVKSNSSSSSSSGSSSSSSGSSSSSSSSSTSAVGGSGKKQTASSTSYRMVDNAGVLQSPVKEQFASPLSSSGSKSIVTPRQGSVEAKMKSILTGVESSKKKKAPPQQQQQYEEPQLL